MVYTLLADAIVAVHVLFMAFVIVGQLLIVVGVLRHWAWVRNPWFRWGHLLGIAIVALESLGDVQCPLTVWEDQLRVMGGSTVEEGATFVGRILHNILIWDVPYNHWGFTVAYVSFALLVVATFVLAPPRRFSRRRDDSPGPGDSLPPPHQPYLSAARSDSTKP